MSSSQRPTRRKTRHSLDHEDEPPAKKTKMDNTVTGGAKRTDGKANRTTKKKPKAAYDENADGFQFTRKTRSTKVQPVSETLVDSTISNTSRTKRKQDSLLGSTPSEEDPVQRRRRSARLSDDKHADASAPVAPKQKRKKKSDGPKLAAPNREPSPQPEIGSLSVAKRRDGTKIALPFADTPVIRRNKEMREKSKAKHRRSSTGLRGRRASSLIDGGTSNGGIILRYTYSTKPFSRSASKAITFSSFLSDVSTVASVEGSIEDQEVVANFILGRAAVPHADVDSRDFYKHIEQSLPEPRRMRQLLTWNGTRALPEKVNGGTGDASEIFAVDSARHMMEELLKDWSNKSEMTDWFSREDIPTSAAIVKHPNPHNLRMSQRAQELEEDVKRLQEERKTWEDLRSANSSTADHPHLKSIPEIDVELLDPSQAVILTTLQSSTTTGPRDLKADLSARLEAIALKLEPQIDLFADGIHKISQYRLAAERVADRILGVTAAQLEKRDRDAREASGTAGVGTREVLSALGGALSEQSR